MKPNFLFISVDQQRFDCVGYSGRRPVKTPNIDRIAHEGIWFDQAYTPIPICCPARQSLVCGQRAERFGALWNYDQGIPVRSLEKEAYSWARELQRSGYHTAYVGAWHGSPEYTPLDFGYEHYVPTAELQARIEQEYPGIVYEHGFYGDKNPVPLEDSCTHRKAEEIIRYIDEFSKEEVPWHVKMDFVEPHLPCRPSEPFASMYKPEDIEKWAAFDDPLTNKPYIQRQQLYNWETQNLSWEACSRMVALYYGYISQVDDAVGRVLSYLEQTRQLDRTIVLFTADHGDMAGNRHMIDKHYVMYDDVVRVPLAIRYPAEIKAGTVSHALVTNMLDIPPTILDWFGIPKPDFLQGESLQPLLGGEVPENWRKYVYSTYNGQQFGLYMQRMLRSYNWKYIWNPTDIDELYNMQQDPNELNNLAAVADSKPLLDRMRLELVRCMEKEGDGILNGWTRRQLEKGNKLPF